MRVVAALLITLVCGCSNQPHSPHSDHRGHPGAHRFDDADKWAKTFDDPARDEWQKPDEVVSRMAIRPGMTIADLGAGTGYFLARLSRAVGEDGRVFGLDVEPDMVRHMAERAVREGLTNVEARQVPMDNPALSDASVDRILIVDTWHHIASRSDYAKKLRAALRPGGQVFVVDFTLEARRGPPAEHRLSAAQTSAELKAAGLEVEILEETLPEQYIVVGTRPTSVED